MSGFPEIKAAIDQTADAFIAFKAQADQRAAALQSRADEIQERIEEIEAKGKSPGKTGNFSGAPAIRLLKSMDGSELPYLTRDQKFADLHREEYDAPKEFDIGAYARAAVMGGHEGKVASGSMLVPTGVGNQIIDMVRAQTVIVEAGAGTIRINGPTNLAKLTGDATIHSHTEAAADITESDITAVAVALNPQLLAALVPLTVELVEDSPNLNELLRTSMAAAFASKIDTLAIAKIIAASGLPVSAVAHDPATWAGTMLAITAALAANQGLPLAHVGTPANFMARAGQLASTAGSWLGRPPALTGMRELFSSSMATDTALLGDFSAVAIAIRSDLTLEIIRHGKPGSGSHLLVAHMRADAVVLQAARLFWQKKTP